MNQPPDHDALADQPVTLINQFTMPTEVSERFLERWKETSRTLTRIMAGKPGFIRARLYRSLSDDAELKFINVSEWDSSASLAAARDDPEFHDTVLRLVEDPDLPVTARPAVYRLAAEAHPDDPR